MAAFRGVWTQAFWRCVAAEFLATLLFVLLSLGATLTWGKNPLTLTLTWGKNHWWKVTKYIYLSTVLFYNFKLFVLYLSVSNFQ